MKLLITPALQMSQEQIEKLKKNHQLYFLIDEHRCIDINGDGIPYNEIEGIVCNYFFVYNSIDVLPNLKFIQLTSAGIDRVPVEVIERNNIQLYTAEDSYVIPMAEWAITKVLDIYKKSDRFFRKQRGKKWEKDRDIQELYGKNALIIGFGNVGSNIAYRLKSFGINIVGVFFNNCPPDKDIEAVHFSQLGEKIKDADIIFLTCALSKETFHIMDDQLLKRVKKGAVLVNVSRGALIDERALVKEANRFLGIALDVFENEPLDSSSVFWRMNNVFISPHNSFVGERNQDRLFSVVMRNLNKEVF